MNVNQWKQVRVKILWNFTKMSVLLKKAERWKWVKICKSEREQITKIRVKVTWISENHAKVSDNACESEWKWVWKWATPVMFFTPVNPVWKWRSVYVALKWKWINTHVHYNTYIIPMKVKPSCRYKFLSEHDKQSSLSVNILNSYSWKWCLFTLKQTN